MPNPETKMTRAEMQKEALVIESLIDAANAICGGRKPEEARELLVLAHERARQLHEALDVIYAPEAVA